MASFFGKVGKSLSNAARVVTVKTKETVANLKAPPTRIPCESCGHNIVLPIQLFEWTCAECTLTNPISADACPSCKKARPPMPKPTIECESCHHVNQVPESNAGASWNKTKTGTKKLVQTTSAKIKSEYANLKSVPPTFNCQHCNTLLTNPNLPPEQEKAQLEEQQQQQERGAPFSLVDEVHEEPSAQQAELPSHLPPSSSSSFSPYGAAPSSSASAQLPPPPPYAGPSTGTFAQMPAPSVPSAPSTSASSFSGPEPLLTNAPKPPLRPVSSIHSDEPIDKVICSVCHKQTSVPGSMFAHKIRSSSTSATRGATKVMYNVSKQHFVSCPLCQHPNKVVVSKEQASSNEPQQVDMECAKCSSKFQTTYRKEEK